MENVEGLPISLVLLDDHDLARAQSAARLARNARLEVVGGAADCAEALRLIERRRPDVVLVETRRHDRCGRETIATLSALEEEMRPAIVAYLEILHMDDWPEARAAGADDVLLKELQPSALVRELEAVLTRIGRLPARSARPASTDPPRI